MPIEWIELNEIICLQTVRISRFHLLSNIPNSSIIPILLFSLITSFPKNTLFLNNILLKTYYSPVNFLSIQWQRKSTVLTAMLSPRFNTWKNSITLVFRFYLIWVLMKVIEFSVLFVSRVRCWGPLSPLWALLWIGSALLEEDLQSLWLQDRLPRYPDHRTQGLRHCRL